MEDLSDLVWSSSGTAAAKYSGGQASAMGQPKRPNKDDVLKGLDPLAFLGKPESSMNMKLHQQISTQQSQQQPLQQPSRSLPLGRSATFTPMQQQQRPGLSGLERSETSKSVNSGVSARVPSSSSHNYHPNVTPSSKGNPLDSIFSFGPSSSAPTALPLAASTAIGIPENTKAVSDPWDLDFLAGPQKSNPATAPLSIPTSTAAATSTTRQTGDIFDLDFLEKQPSAMGSVMSSSASSLSLPPLSPPRPETSHSFHSDPQRPASSPMARPPDSSPSNNTNGVGVSHRDADLERLISAGFAPEEARNAIEASGGDVQMAVELLFENRGGYQQHQRDSSSSPVVREELSSPVHDKISFWESKQQQSTSGPDKLASRASAFGASFLKSAKTALDYSKRKITEAVEKAVEAHQTHQSSSPARSFATGKTPPRDWHPPSSFAPYKDADANNEGPPPSNFTPPHDKASPAPKLVLQKPSKKEAVSNPPTPLLMDLAPPKYSSPSTVPNVKQRAVNLFDDDSSSPVTTKHSATIAHTADFAVALPKASPPAQPPKKALVQASPSQLSESAEYKEKGNTQFKAGQYAEAEMWYSKAIDCLPSGHSSLAPLYNNRAGARLKTGSYNEAVRDCNLVQELEPNELKSLLRRASAYEALEKWEYAQSDYRSIMAIDSCVKSASRGLARCTKALKPLKAEETMELDFLGNPVTPKASPSSGLQDLQSRSKSISTSSAQVKHAVDAAVQQVRAKHQQAEDEEVMKLALKDQTDDKINVWRKGKEDNLRALLSSLDAVLWPALEWKSINLSELLTPAQVKVKYMKAVGKVHPDKLNQATALEHKLIANGVFSTLNKAWDSFKTQNGM